MTQLPDLLTQLRQGRSLNQHLALSEMFLSRHPATSTEYDTLICQALRLMHARPDVQISDLCRQLYVCERHFRRLFQAALGIQPKKYQKLVRSCTALLRLHHGRFNKLTDLAHDCGFYDQSHFINEFKEFTGMTPSDYRRAPNLTAITQRTG